MSFLEALNPWSSCLSVTDFEDALIDIKGILTAVDSEIPDLEKKVLLEKAFQLTVTCLNASSKQKTDKQLSFLLAETLRQYSTLCYHDNYFAAKQLLVIAFNLHLYTIGIFNECIDLKNYPSLEDLKKQSESNPLFSAAMEHSILTMSIDRCISLAYTDSFLQHSPKRRLYSLAETARWLGHCYQNINETQAVNSENDLRFSQLFHLSESLHLFIDDETSKKALADLYFQAWPFMHQRKNSSDISETCQLYEKALVLDPSTEMQLKTAMIRFATLFANGRKNEALPFMLKALTDAEMLEETAKNRFLLFSLHDHCARYHMDTESLNIQAAEESFSKACQYRHGKEWLPFALFDMRYAEFKYVTGEFEPAKRLIESSLSTLRKQPFSNHPFLHQAEALKSIIDKTITGT